MLSTVTTANPAAPTPKTEDDDIRTGTPAPGAWLVVQERPDGSALVFIKDTEAEARQTYRLGLGADEGRFYLAQIVETEVAK